MGIANAQGQESPKAKEPTPAAKENYKTNCALCHGTAGEGSDMGKALNVKDLRSKEIQDMKDDEIKKAITNGNGSMPAFGSKFSAAELDDLVTLIRSFKPKPSISN
jgi:cytochrome c6